MRRFTVHWSRVSGDYADALATRGRQLYAIWPGPVVHADDPAFQLAGFGDIISDTGESDFDLYWDTQADSLLTRLLAELQKFGEPHLIGEPFYHDPVPWPLRLFGKTGDRRPFELREEIELRLHVENVPNCVITFGGSGVCLRTGGGHRLFWIELPAVEAAPFVACLDRTAGGHPLIRTNLKWELLIP